MDETKATMLATMIGGEAWNSGGGIWLVKKQNSSQSLVVISDEAVCEYASEEAFDAGDAKSTILLV